LSKAFLCFSVKALCFSLGHRQLGLLSD
jgi:hypothetical protein